MKKKWLLFFLPVLLFFLATSPVWCQTSYPKGTEEWLKTSELGSYELKSYDEKGLYEKAKLEKEVSIYSYSSRVHEFGKTFEAQYPGIKVKGFDMDSTEIVTKILAEQKAENFVADVIFLKDPATVLNELMKKGYVFNYVPSSFFSFKTKDPFGASVSLWWFGESFMDIAPYINDARNQELLLRGSITGKDADYGYHDWEFILNEVGLLRYDDTLAYIAQSLGIVLMLLSFAWAGYILFEQYRHVDLA